MGSQLKILKLCHVEIVLHRMRTAEVLSRFISVQILLSQRPCSSYRELGSYVRKKINTGQLQILRWIAWVLPPCSSCVVSLPCCSPPTGQSITGNQQKVAAVTTMQNGKGLNCQARSCLWKAQPWNNTDWISIRSLLDYLHHKTLHGGQDSIRSRFYFYNFVLKI